LSIFVKARNKFSILSNADFGPLISLLNEYAHRCQDLVLDLPINVFLHLEGDPQGRSILKTLKFVPLVLRGAPPQAIRGAFCSNNFYHKPTLVDISLLPFSSIGINWSNVTQVKVGNFSVDQVFELLRAAPSMIQCSVFSVSANEDRYPIPGTFISHPNLEYLHLRVKFEGANLLFSHLSLPSLGVLILEWCGVLNTRNFISLIERSSPPLRTLSIADPTLNTGNLFQLLEAVPTITTLQLKLSRGHNTKALFQVLTDSSLISSDEGRRQPLPKLEVFEYSLFRKCPWSAIPKLFGPISELDHPRRRPLSRLYIRCHIRDSDELLITDRETVSQIQDLMDKGMKVEIVNVGSSVYDRDILRMSIELHD
jgi:hypothetical protein